MTNQELRTLDGSIVQVRAASVVDEIFSQVVTDFNGSSFTCASLTILVLKL